MNIAVLKEKLEALDQRFCDSNSLSERKTAKALVLDLGDESFFEWPIPEQYLEAYVSGPALGARLWADFAGADIEEPTTYEAHNPIVYTVSSLSNSGMPGCESLSIAFRSPVSGNLTFNVLSNTFGMRLMALGYMALVIIGRLRRPTVISIRKSGVSYNVSEVFIGYRVSQIEELIGTGPMTSAMSIGPAGEQKVPYAAVVSEGMTTGRGGLGCVFGFKNIKSLCITGFCTDFIRGGNADEIKAAMAPLKKALTESRYNVSMQRCGTAYLVKSSSKNGWAPVFNFSRRTDPRLFHLGGDEVARRYGKEHGGCIACPVLCRHRTADGIMIPGYESILMLGSNLGCFDMDRIIERHAQCLDFGLDPVSTGSLLGWVSQATAEGRTAILGDDFSFTDNSKVLPLIEMIAKRLGPGETLSYGTYALGKAIGDDSYAYTIRGLECGPYDYRGAFSQAITDSMGLWFTNQFEIVADLCKKAPADWAVFNESLVMGLESLGISSAMIIPAVVEPVKHLKRASNIIPKLAIKIVKPKLLADAASSINGQNITSETIMQLGDRCWRLIYEINRALGFDMLRDTESLMPNHFCIDPLSNHNKDSIVPFRALMDRYVFLRKQTIAIQTSDLNAN